MLALIVDLDFPFSRPSIHFVEFEKTGPRPHVEAAGKLCLRSALLPSDPVASVQGALGEALALLKDNAAGRLEDDFQIDFQLYWNHRAPNMPVAAALLRNIDASTFGACILSDRGPCIFPTKSAALDWWGHRAGGYPRKMPRVGVIRLERLPAPAQFPTTAADLAWLVGRNSKDGLPILGEVLRQIPKIAIVVLAGDTPNGTQHLATVRLARPRDVRGQFAHWRTMAQPHPRGSVPLEVLCRRYELTRLRTERLDAAISRLPYSDRDRLAKRKVAIIGCGALGSGVAKLLAQSGVGKLLLVDHEILGWENIRRHELGARFIGNYKSEALAHEIQRNAPDITSVESLVGTIQDRLRANPRVLEKCDLIVSCTADWASDCALEHYQRSDPTKTPAMIFAWMEAFGLAAHAVAIRSSGPLFTSGFNVAGDFKLPASETKKTPPPECGASTTPFGAIELRHAQSLTANLAVDFLRDHVSGAVWRSWLTNQAALDEAEAAWRDEWKKRCGAPPASGAVVEQLWAFDDRQS